jgi:hypothetical protein
MKVTEHSIVPALEKGGPGALVLAEGFSCTMQISQIYEPKASEHLVCSDALLLAGVRKLSGAPLPLANTSGHGTCMLT